MSKPGPDERRRPAGKSYSVQHPHDDRHLDSTSLFTIGRLTSLAAWINFDHKEVATVPGICITIADWDDLPENRVPPNRGTSRGSVRGVPGNGHSYRDHLSSLLGRASWGQM
jgi:hypothetical protein